MADDFRIRFDWAKDGTFGTTGQDNVTDRVRGRVSCSYGRPQSTALSLVAAGAGAVDLDNADRRYSPRVTTGPLFGQLRPARPVLFERTVLGTTYTLFRAHTDNSPINPDLDSKRVTFSLVDSLADFRGVNISTELLRAIWPGEAIDAVLDAAGWTGGRDIEQGATIFPWWWADGEDAFDALQKIVASEGPPALLTIDSTGAIVFRGRHHRLVNSRSTTSQGTWRGTVGSAEPVMSTGFRYDEGWQNVVNQVEFSVNERAPAAVTAHVWESDDLFSLGASEVETIVVQTTDPFYDASPPEDGRDFELLSGSLSSVTLSRTSGASTSITLTAGGSGARMLGMALTARSVPVKRVRRVSATDSGSITAFGARGMPAGTDPVWANRWDADAIAELACDERSDPLAVLTVRFVCGLSDQVRLSKLLAYDLSDRITVIEPETGTAADFFIESIAHEFSGREEHVITFGLEAVPAATSGTFPFQIGTSVIGTGVLGR